MLLRLAIAATIASCTVTTATVRADAQSSSAWTITLVVVPFPAGGPTDTIGRIIAEGLQSSLGQPVIIENAPEATGSVRTGKVARAEESGPWRP
jgi:tripartite-type tricarboxylate transporter receptor subunit TctC